MVVESATAVQGCVSTLLCESPLDVFEERSRQFQVVFWALRRLILLTGSRNTSSCVCEIQSRYLKPKPDLLSKNFPTLTNRFCTITLPEHKC